MRNAMLDEPQAGIKIALRNIDNLRYEGDTTLITDSEKELKSLLMKVKAENVKAGLKINVQKMSTSRQYIVTLLIQRICRVYHEKCWAGRSTSWNQDCLEKYQ